MAAAQYIGVGGVARKVKSQFMGVGGVARKVKNGFLGVGGVARKCVGGETVTISGSGTSWGHTIPAGATVSGWVRVVAKFTIASGSYTDQCTFNTHITLSQVTLPHRVTCGSDCFSASSTTAIEGGSYGEVTLSATGISADFHVEFGYGEKYNRVTNADLTQATQPTVAWSITYTT